LFSLQLAVFTFAYFYKSLILHMKSVLNPFLC